MSVGSRKLHAGEDLAPEPLTKLPYCPKSLTGKEGKAMWKNRLTLMIEEYILCEWDLKELECMCLEWQGYKDTLADIAEHGTSFISKTGVETLRPVVAEKNKCLANYLKLSDKHGGNSLSRARIKRVSPVEKTVNKFADI